MADAASAAAEEKKDGAAGVKDEASKDKALARKGKKAPAGNKKKTDAKTDGKRGHPKTGRSNPKVRLDEATVLKGVSKPATRRIFKQTKIPGDLRLSDKTTDPIRATIGFTTQRVVEAMVRAVIAAGRKTAYLCDSRDAVKKELPRSSTFA